MSNDAFSLMVNIYYILRNVFILHIRCLFPKGNVVYYITFYFPNVRHVYYTTYYIIHAHVS